jgi:hypothetical protein
LVDFSSVIIGLYFQAGSFIFAVGLEINHNHLEIVMQVIILIVLESGFRPDPWLERSDSSNQNMAY